MLARWRSIGVSRPIGKGLELFNQSEVQFSRENILRYLWKCQKSLHSYSLYPEQNLCSRSFRWSHLKMTFILFVLTFLSSSIKIQSSNNFGRNKESTRFAECIKKYCLKKYHIFAQNDFFRPETLVLGHKHFKTNAGLCYPRSSLVNQFQATFLQLSF